MHLSCTIAEISGPKVIGSRPWLFGVTWRHHSRDHRTRHMWFSVGDPLEPCVYVAPLRRYKASKLHLPILKGKSSLRMLRVTWPVGRGSKMTTYLEFPRPYYLPCRARRSAAIYSCPANKQTADRCIQPQTCCLTMRAAYSLQCCKPTEHLSKSSLMHLHTILTQHNLQPKQCPWKCNFMF